MARISRLFLAFCLCLAGGEALGQGPKCVGCPQSGGSSSGAAAGLSDPGASGIVKRTALNTTAPATTADFLPIAPGVAMGTYDASVTYNHSAFVVDQSGNSYQSTASGNVGHALTDTNWWTFRGPNANILQTIVGIICGRGTNPNGACTQTEVNTLFSALTQLTLGGPLHQVCGGGAIDQNDDAAVSINCPFKTIMKAYNANALAYEVDGAGYVYTNLIQNPYSQDYGALTMGGNLYGATIRGGLVGGSSGATLWNSPSGATGPIGTYALGPSETVVGYVGQNGNTFAVDALVTATSATITIPRSLFRLAGTTSVTTITPPVNYGFNGANNNTCIPFKSTASTPFGTGGNISSTAFTTTAGKMYTACWWGADSSWTVE